MLVTLRSLAAIILFTVSVASSTLSALIYAWINDVYVASSGFVPCFFNISSNTLSASDNLPHASSLTLPRCWLHR